MDKQARQSIWSVVVGVVFIIVVTTVVDLLLHLLGVFPPLEVPIDDKLSALALAYRVVISVAGAYLTAHMAPDKPMKHALILGVVGTFLGGLGAAATWGRGLGPAWYPISIAAVAVPQCWLGGKLYVMRQARTSA